jgi:type IV secretory pathway TraG/TraD family ATPase VirD4
MFLLFIVFPVIGIHLLFVYFVATRKYADFLTKLFEANIKVYQMWPYYGDSERDRLAKHFAELVWDENIRFAAMVLMEPIWWTVIIGAIAWIGLILFARMQKTQGYIKGARLLSEKAYIGLSKKIGAHRFHIGRVPLPYKNETTHVFVVGAPGKGKTLLMRKVIRQAIADRQKGLILDVNGDWVPDCYRADVDLIFNPLDERSIKWTIFNDVSDPIAIRNFCAWIIPVTNQKAPFFEEAARFILESIMLKCIKTGVMTNVEIRRIASLSPFEMSQELDGYGRGGDLVGEKANKDVLATFKRAMAFIDFLEDGDFSVREFVNQESHGFIFLSNTSKTAEAFKPLLTAFANVFVSYSLLLPDDLKRRIYVFFDEFGRLGKVDQIKDLVLLGRSKGISLWLTSQDLNQIACIYSEDEMLSIINSFSNFAVFALNEPKGAKFWSEKFGQQDFFEISETVGMGPHANRDGLNINKQRKTDFIIKDSEILYLPERELFVKLNNIDACTKTTVEILPAKTNCSAIIEREISIDSMIRIAQAMSAEPIKENEQEVKTDKKDFYTAVVDEIELSQKNAEDFTY